MFRLNTGKCFLNSVHFLRRYVHAQRFKMDKAYLRHCPDGEHFNISFELSTERIKRKFNMSRKLTETVEVFLTRIQANVDKAVNKKKKNQGAPPTAVSLLLNSEQAPKDRPCQDIFLPGNQVQLAINDQPLTVVINSPWVETISLPSSILATFPTYPSKFDTIYVDKNASEFTWFKSEDNIKWEEVANGFIHTPHNDDIGCFLKLRCLPKNDDLVGPEIEVVSSCKVEASPGDCPFEKRHAFTRNKLCGSEFRVVSYNLLADLYCDSDYTREVLFPYCPPYALSIDYRKQLFLKEIIGYNADIICLQEVDRKVFKNDLHPTLSHLDYQGTLDLKGGEVAEGLALFYDAKRFIQLDKKTLIFSEEIDKNPIFEDIWFRIKTNEKLAERIKLRTTTLQTNVLGSLEHDSVLIVANTHFYFHPDADHIRLLHGSLAIRFLEQFVREIKDRYVGKKVALIFCGDFNTVPSCGIYQLYTRGSVPGSFIDYKSNQEEAIENVDVQQPFRLESACGTPDYTNFTAGFADCLDYIFFEKDKMSVRQIVPLPSEQELKENVALPSVVFPSDHVSLVADLQWL